MRILIVIPRQDRISGNWVTAHRFQHGLKKHGHQVALHDAKLQTDGVFRQQLLDFAPDVTILLHAYRSGKPWLKAASNLSIPYVVLLTGTDVNHGLDDPDQIKTIHTIMRQAAFVLLQNPLIVAGIKAVHPKLTTNLRELTPGIVLGTVDYDLRAVHSLEKQQTLFLCPAGLRPVKGVLELLQMFDQVAMQSSTFHLAFCGPILDEGYAQCVFDAIEQRPWASYLGSITPGAMANAMRGADVIINNSQTEGLANALLEAATIGLPILARKIPGNAAVVRHDNNGLLYSNKSEFTRYALQLLNRERRQQLSCPDPDRYNPDKETAELITILQKTISMT
ncbi:MAG: glycosyltransferase family 4 protein [Desulfuromonadales bacterium]|nr:glycosyltransferase family 4 protein [Desulfuromonadales bacterium]